MECLAEDMHQASTPKKRRLSRMSSQEEMMVQVKPDNTEGKTGKTCRPPRSRLHSWPPGVDGSLCFSFGVSVKALEPHHVPERPKHSHPHWGGNGGSDLLQGLHVEARVRFVVRPGHTAHSLFSVKTSMIEQQKKNCNENKISCTLGRKSLLTLFFFLFVSFGLFSDSNLWFPLNPSTAEPVPTCASGHSATYDPDSRAVFVYGGLRESQRYSDLYILDTRTWRWRLVNVGLCKLPYVLFYK